MEAGGKVLEIGEGVAVRSSGQVETAVIAAGPPRTIGFGDKMERRGPGTVGAANNTRLLQFVKLIPGLLELDRNRGGELWQKPAAQSSQCGGLHHDGGMVEKVSGENCGILAEELANLRLQGIKTGENKRGGGGRWRRSGPAKGSVGGFVEDLAGSHINKEVMGSKKIGA
jgi:hypothetical protein